MLRALSDVHSLTVFFIVRILISIDYYKSTGLLSEARVMLPATTHSPLVWELLDVLRIKFPKEPLIYAPGENRSDR